MHKNPRVFQTPPRALFANGPGPDLPFVRPGASLLTALLVACGSLTACGDSNSPDNQSQATAPPAGGEGAETAEAAPDESRFNEDGVPPGDVNTMSAKAVLPSDLVDSDTSGGASGGIAVKDVAAPVTKPPSFGPGPYTVGRAIVRTIGTYPGGTAVAGRRYRNNVLIPGATRASYTIEAADMGKELVYEELVENNTTKVRTWYRSATVSLGLPTMTKAPSFGPGPFAVGASVTRVVGTYVNGTPVGSRRYRNNVLIPGATGASYTITDADAGHKLVYEEEVEAKDTKIRKWFRSAEVTVTTMDPIMVKAPSIGTGPFVPGAVLTRVIGDYPGSTPIAGRRYRNNVLIPGATAASYTITAADVGQQLVYEEDAQRNDTGTRKSFRSAPVTVAAASQAAAPAPAPAPATVNSAEIIVNDMKLNNDFVLKGYENFTTGWYTGPGTTNMGSNPAFSNSPPWSIFYNNPNYIGKVAQAALPWVVIFDGVNHAASNVAVEMRNMLTYMKSKSTGRWTLLGGPAYTTGTYYGKPNTGLPAMDEVMLSSTSTSSVIKVPENRGYFWHGWWGAGRLPVNPNDIAAMFVTIQARLVVADPSRPDDRARAQVGLQVGADYYLTTTSIYPEWYAPAVGINRTKTINNNWQAYNFTTFSDVGSQDPGGGISEAAFRAAPPPLQ